MTSKLPSPARPPHAKRQNGAGAESRLSDAATARRPRQTLKDGLTPIVDELVKRGITLAQARREFERQLIEASIRSNQGNMGRAAHSLGVHRNTLRNKVSDLGIQRRQVVERAMVEKAIVEKTARRADDF